MAAMDTTKGQQQQQTDGVKPKSERRLATEAAFKQTWARIDMNDAELVAELRDFEEKLYEGIDAMENGDYRTYTRETIHELFEDVKRRGIERRQLRKGQKAVDRPV